tara:strand:- start:467 stop:1012 length:546 start_codon:yes stop_codon:yes gene_type:complete
MKIEPEFVSLFISIAAIVLSIIALRVSISNRRQDMIIRMAEVKARSFNEAVDLVRYEGEINQKINVIIRKLSELSQRAFPLIRIDDNEYEKINRRIDKNMKTMVDMYDKRTIYSNKVDHMREILDYEPPSVLKGIEWYTSSISRLSSRRARESLDEREADYMIETELEPISRMLDEQLRAK